LLGLALGESPGSLTKHTSGTMMYSIRKESNNNQSLKMSKKSQTQTLPQVTFDFFAAYKLFQSMKSLQQLPKRHPPNPHSTPILATPPLESLPEELLPVAELSVSHQLLQAKVSLVDIGNF